VESNYSLGMVNTNGKEHYLPSREISYAYAVAMFFSQHLELDLRAVLYTTDYQGWGNDVELDEDELKRFKNTDALIDRGTCGIIIKKLKSTGIIKDGRVWKRFDLACEHRNKLAHRFFAEQNFNLMTKQRETEIISLLNKMAVELYQALLISRKVREKVEHLSDEDHKKMQKYLGEFLGSDFENPNRVYSSRNQKKKI
jgi:hypothetical protein